MIYEVFLARGGICNVRYKMVVYYDLLHLIVKILGISSLVEILSGNSVLMQLLSPLLFSGGWMLRHL